MYKLKIGSELQDMLAALPNAEQTKLGNYLLANANEHIVQSFLNDNVSADERPNYLNPSVDDVGKLSWTTNKKIQLYSFDNDEQIYINSDRRIRSKVGRTINKIFCSNFLEGIGVDNHDIDKFVRQLKCYNSSDDDVDYEVNFAVTTNFDYYGEHHTSMDARDGCGSLGESCMRHDGCIESNFFEIYEDNNVSLLIHTNEDGDIDARALLWEMDCGTKVMDRIYTDFDHKEELFKKYAKNHGYWYKKRQSYSDKTTFINTEGEIVEDFGFFFTLKHGRGYDNVAYLDTFSYSFEYEGYYYLTNSPKLAYEKYNVLDFFLYDSVDGYYNNHQTSVGVTYIASTGEVSTNILNESYEHIYFDYNEKQDNYTPRSVAEGSKLYKIADLCMDNFCENTTKDFREDSWDNEDDILLKVKLIGEDIYHGIVLDGDGNERRHKMLKSEGFYCDYSGSTYYSKHFKSKTIKCNGRYLTYRDIDIIKTHDGTELHKGNARVLYIKGKAKVCTTEVSAVRTFDGLPRPESECTIIENHKGEGVWFSELVHKKEIVLAEKLLARASMYKGEKASNLPTVFELSEGKHDDRKTY